MRPTRRFALAAAGAALAACGSPSAPDASFTQVTERTSCEALLSQYCAGAFGFTVQGDGRFTVGPAPDGTSLTGALTEPERLQISSDAAQVSSNLGAARECDPTHTIPGSSDQIDLMDPRLGSVRVYDLGGTPGSVCYRGGRDQAARLHADLGALLSRYYPRPFPPL